VIVTVVLDFRSEAGSFGSVVLKLSLSRYHKAGTLQMLFVKTQPIPHQKIMKMNAPKDPRTLDAARNEIDRLRAELNAATATNQ
jgi:hypothetical protein